MGRIGNPCFQEGSFPQKMPGVGFDFQDRGPKSALLPIFSPVHIHTENLQNFFGKGNRSNAPWQNSDRNWVAL